MGGRASLLDRTTQDGNLPPPSGPSGGGEGGGPPGPGDSSLAVLGVWLALVPILVLFLTLCTAYVLRQGAHGPEIWAPLPSLVWVNTLVLLASSVCLEKGRRAQRLLRLPSRWFSFAFALGVLFLLGQIAAWIAWWKSGMEPGATPHSAFFYILTGTHGAHLLGGLALLGMLTFRDERPLLGLRPALLARLTAIYWHFLSVLWLGLLALLQLWR